MNISFRPQFSAKCVNKEHFANNWGVTAIITVLEATSDTTDVSFRLDRVNYDSPLFKMRAWKSIDNKLVPGSRQILPDGISILGANNEGKQLPIMLQNSQSTK